jgi:hypothetical protein
MDSKKLKIYNNFAKETLDNENVKFIEMDVKNKKIS